MGRVIAHKPVGIDLGCSCIKAVQVRRTGHTARIVGIYTRENKREGAGRCPIETLGESSQTIFSESKVRTDCFSSSFPLYSAIVRNTVVPFSGRKKIKQMIKFQAEPHIPFPIEEVIVDFHEIGGAEGDQTPLIIVGAKKELVGTHLEILARGGVDPEIVGVDAFALLNNYLVRAGEETGEAVVLLDIGASKTLLVILKGHSVLLTRSINVAGDHITEALQKEFKIDFHEAESMKKEHGAAVREEKPSPDRVRIQRAISPVLARLTREVDRSIRSVSASLKGAAPSCIYLSGGGALLSGMRDLLALEFNCEAQFLCHLSPLAGSSDDETMCRMAVATGLALQGLGLGDAEINLRQEEYSHAGTFAKIRRQIVMLTCLCACVAAILTFNFVRGFGAKRREYLSLEKNLQLLYGRTFPDEERVKAASVVSMLRNKLNAYLSEYESFSILSQDAVSSLEILREISILMPQDIKAQLTDLSISQDDVELEGLINNPGDADKIRLNLANSHYFSKVDIPSTSQEGKKYKFKLVAAIKKYGAPPKPERD